METRWLYRTTENFDELRKASEGVCVIPMGCSEKHGLHLPVGTDIIAASRIAYLASQIEPFCVFPDFTFGDIADSSPRAPDGIIVFPLSLQVQLLETMCENIARQGFNKILVYNGHGGNNPWLSSFAREIRKKKRNFVFAYAEVEYCIPNPLAKLLIEHGTGYFPELTPEDEKILLSYHERNIFVGHACVNESAYMLGLTPENVHLDKLGKESGAFQDKTAYLRENGIRICNGGWDINYPNSYAGDDHPDCTENIGKLAVRFETERFAKAVKVFKQDENLVKWQEEYQRGW